MTPFEQHLADALRTMTPEPPRTLTADDVIAPTEIVTWPADGRRPHRPRWWAAAAAAVVLLVAATVLIAVRRPDGRLGADPTPAGPTTPSSAATASVSTSRSHPPETAGLPWAATVETPLTLEQGSLTASGTVLYGIYPRGNVVRLDARTGAVARRYNSRDGWAFGRVVAVGSTLWVLVQVDAIINVEVLERLDPVTLRRQQRILIPGARDARGRMVAGRGVLFVANGPTVLRVDVATGRVTHFFEADASVTALAVRGDDLFVADRQHDSSSVYRVDASGIALSRTTFGYPVSGLDATVGGLWVTTAGGMTTTANYYPAADLTRQASAGLSSGGSIPVSVRTIGNVTWVGGSYSLSCVDASSGRVLASADMRPPAAALGDVVAVAGKYYGYGQSVVRSHSGVARFRPPSACS